MSEGSQRGVMPSPDGIDSLISDLEAEVLNMGVLGPGPADGLTNNCTSGRQCYTF